MDRIRGVLRQLRTLFRKQSVERDLAEEMSFHVEMQVQANVERGMDEAAARRAALIAFGGVERYKEQRRQASWVRVPEDVAADARFTLRSLRRSPAFTAAVVITLGLGIGGTTAIFSVVDGLFLRTPAGVLDASDVRKLYMVRDVGSVTTPEGGPGSYLDYEALRDGTRAFSGVTAMITRQVDLGRGAEAEQLRAAAVTANHFEVLGVRPALGRFFAAEEDVVQGSHPVVVLSHGLWQRRFGGAPDVIGRTLLVNGTPVNVIGVTERSFVGTDSDPLDLWVPAAMAGPLTMMGFGADMDWRTQTGMAAVSYLARLAPGATDEAAMADGSAALAQMATAHEGMDATPELMLSELTAASGPWRSEPADLSLWLAVIAGVVLIIACANVANLLLARAITRRRELALRLSLGAGRGRLLRQSLTESVVLALLGGAAGLLVAYWSAGIIRQFPLPPWAGNMDARLLTFALMVSVITGLVFGVLPALRSVRVDPLKGMQDTRIAIASSRSGTRRALVALQVGLSLSLLIGAGLFVRSLRQVQAIDAGVDLDRLVVVQIDLAKAGFRPEEIEQFWEQARTRLGRMPQVEGSGIVHFAPFLGMSYGGLWSVPGQEPVKFDNGPHFNMAGPDYFTAAGLRVLEGRQFTAADATGTPVAVLNRAFADAIAPPGGSAVGMCMLIGRDRDAPCTLIVGVVENQRVRYLEDTAVPMLFMARDQDPNAIAWGGPSLMVRVTENAEEQAAFVRVALQGMRSDLPFVNTRPLTELIRNDLLPYRLGATLFTMFGVLALILAGVGLYSVLGFFVTERRPEIGIRRSLGAPAASVVSLVVRQSMVPVAAGAVAGLLAAFVGTRFMATLLFGVDVRDPVSFAAALLFLLVTAAVATAVPAVRAMRVDPAVVLRE